MENRLKSREILVISRGKNDKAQFPFSVEVRCAFASVTKCKGMEKGRRDARELRSRQGYAMGTLNHDVARLICEFAATDSSRTVWVDDC
jgi:hypothetical protein